MVKHEINNDPSHRYVKPDGHGKTSKSAMSVKPRPQRRYNGNDDKRQDRECQQKVGDQDDIINGTNLAFRGKFHRTLADGTHQAKMVSQIAAQESG